MNFSEAKTLLESLTELVKKTATLDLQEKIISLREYVVSLKDENITLMEENQALKLEISLDTDFELRGGLMWMESDNTPYCQKCLEGSKKKIHLQRYGSGWKCFECEKFYDPTNSGGARIFRPKKARVNPAE